MYKCLDQHVCKEQITVTPTALHYTALHYTTLHCTTLHSTTLHSTTLHYTTLYCTALPGFTCSSRLRLPGLAQRSFMLARVRACLFKSLVLCLMTRWFTFFSSCICLRSRASWALYPLGESECVCVYVYMCIPSITLSHGRGCALSLPLFLIHTHILGPP
jgi:hypothetical protein